MLDRISATIHQLAVDEQRRLVAQIARLQDEKLEAERSLREIQLKLNAASLAPDRLAKFQIVRGPHHQCPRCWIKDGNASDLSCVGSASSEDIFRCHTCGLEFSVA